MEPTFLEQSNDRTLAPDYVGPLLLWDIDKTYLNTRFSSFWGLAAIPFELAIDKEAIPGVVPLIRALRHGPSPTSAIVPLYFISGSPPQLRHVIQKKMTLDGVDFDGITFKDQWGLVRAGRAREVMSQVGYKLKALLLYRQVVPDGARWLMFGDDAEDDADVFLLFGEVCAGLRGEALERRLVQENVHPRDRTELLAICESVPVGPDPVDLICIRQERKRTFAGYDARVVATSSYLGTALCCAERGYIRPEAIAGVARALRRRGVSDRELMIVVDDARHRLGVREELLAYAAA